MGSDISCAKINQFALCIYEIKMILILHDTRFADMDEVLSGKKAHF